MKDRDLIALIAAVIWAHHRGQLDGKDDLEEIQESVQFANDILTETDAFIEREEQEAEAEAEILPPKRNSR